MVSLCLILTYPCEKQGHNIESVFYNVEKVLNIMECVKGTKYIVFMSEERCN